VQRVRAHLESSVTILVNIYPSDDMHGLTNFRPDRWRKVGLTYWSTVPILVKCSLMGDESTVDAFQTSEQLDEVFHLPKKHLVFWPGGVVLWPVGVLLL